MKVLSLFDGIACGYQALKMPKSQLTNMMRLRLKNTQSKSQRKITPT